MTESIRVMFYDKTDWAGYGLVKSWFAGGLLYKSLRNIDLCKGVSSWEEALDWLLMIDPDKKISSIQFWGHGTWGNIYVNGEAINTNVLRKNHKDYSKMLALKDRLTDDALIWFRTCATFGSSKGHYFAKRWAKFFDCTVAGHTYTIGPFQSGLHTLKAGETPTWDPMEGIEEGTAEEPEGTTKWSHFWLPNTIFCLRGEVPSEF